MLRRKLDVESAFAFKKDTPLDKRRQLCERLRTSYPDRIPVIVERDPRSNIPEIARKKFLAPADISVGKFLAEIRMHLSISNDQSVYIFVNGNVIPQAAASLSQVYEQYKDADDGFLYVVYSGENTFGTNV